MTSFRPPYWSGANDFCLAPKQHKDDFTLLWLAASRSLLGSVTTGYDDSESSLASVDVVPLELEPPCSKCDGPNFVGLMIISSSRSKCRRVRSCSHSSTNLFWGKAASLYSHRLYGHPGSVHISSPDLMLSNMYWA